MRLVYAIALLAVTAARAQSVCDGVPEVPNTDLARVTVASGLTTGMSGPLFVTAPPGDTSRIFIVLQNGTIRQLARGAAATASTVFLDIDARVVSTSDEQGLLGLAFDPGFATNGTFYVYYTRSTDGDEILARYRTLDGTGATAGDPNSETILFRIDDSEANHNGGWMSFGPDGMLYISEGDGGGAGDVHGTCGNGQDTQTLKGKILRIDPRGAGGGLPDCGLDAGPYRIPAGNPLADGAGTGDCDEIWAYGLRNPWRNSFDTATGDLYIADVGQGCWEEINWQPASSHGGENYGWRNFEGRHCYDGSNCSATASPAGCSPACSDPSPSGDPAPNGTRLPIWDYAHGSGCSITGGYVYRGCRMRNFRGTYFYGDYCAGTVSSLVQSGGLATNQRDWTAQLGSALQFDLTSFGTDAQGELYIADRDGMVYAVVPPLPDMEVAGTGSDAPFRLEKSGIWTWEDLHTASWQPVTAYRVYRANLTDGRFNAGEIFSCIHTGSTPSWTGGDPSSPALGDMFAYVVTAVNSGGQQTSPGGTPLRTLAASACP
jgi:glucose/arabinose dehydrogenase